MRDFQFPSRSAILAGSAAAATSHPRATLAAIECLRAGGNAVDAAVTAAAVLTVVEPHMTSLGGDCFCIVAEPDGGIHCINGSGAAASAIDPYALLSQELDDISADSIHAITVPGCVATLSALLSKHGSIGLDAALSAAIDVAETGAPVAPRVALDWAMHVDALAANTGSRRHFLKAGLAPDAGDTMVYPALAKALRAIAENGPDVFYRGWIADDLLNMLQAEGSALTHDDFAAFKPDPVSPVGRAYGGADVLGFPPNTQGFAVLAILGIMERFGPWSGDPLDPRRLHVFLEAVRRAYAVRNRHIGDARMLDLSAETLISDDTIDRLAATIAPDTVSAFDGIPDLTGSHTVYLTVVDAQGRAVSLINSIFEGFGSKRTGPLSGIVMHNRGFGFNLEIGHPNCVGPRKRPMHTLIPGMVLKNGLPLLSYGVMGGAYQAAGHAYVLSNILDYGMDPQSALDLPRVFIADVFHPEKSTITVEKRVPRPVLSNLAARGHRAVKAIDPIGGGQIIQIDRERGCLVAGSDPRKDGLALGY